MLKILKRLKNQPPPTQEIASARRMPLGMSLTPYSPDDLVQRKGLDIYDQMQTDSQVSATLATKKFATLSRGWELAAASKSTDVSAADADAQAAEFCRFALQDMIGSVEDVLFGILDALAKGYSISEINFCTIESGRWQGKIGLHSIKHKDPALYDFRMDEFHNITGLVRLPVDGEPERNLPAGKFVVYTYMPAYAEPKGHSDLRACYKHWWTKEIMIRFFSSYMERFGSPVIKGTYKRGTTRAQQEELLRILDRIQQETAIVVPEDVTVDLLEAAFHGEAGFLDAIQYHDRQIAKAILGETLTQEEGLKTGSMALGQIHQDTMMLRLGKIKRDLEETVMREQVLKPLVSLNFANAAAPRFQLGSLQDRDLDKLSTVLERLTKTQTIKPTEPWIRDWLGIPA